jgi:hypothetical protein
MPGVKIGDAEISIEYADVCSDGRDRYRVYIDAPGIEYVDQEIRSGFCGGSLQSGLSSLMSFLGAAAESFNHKGSEGENADLFPPHIVEWACQNSSEIEMLACELEQNPELIKE